MSLSLWLRSLKTRLDAASSRRNQTKPSRVTPRRKTPMLERLEDRLTPATLTVNSTADTVSGTIATLDLREAIQLINTGGTATDTSGNSLSAAKASQIDTTNPFGTNDIIVFAPGLDGQTITLGGTALEISANLTITGLGASNLTISGNNASRIFTIDPDLQVSISGLTLQDGYNSVSGGAIITASNLIVNNCTLSDNSSGSFGGAIYNYNLATLVVSGSTFSDNSTNIGGGGICNGSTLSVSNSIFSDNVGGVGGGIDNLGGTVTVDSSSFSDNSGSTGGGIYTGYHGTTSISDTYLTNNSSSGDGAAIYNSAGLNIYNSYIEDNSSTGGSAGGIYNTGSLNVRSTTFFGNSADGTDGSGGGINNDDGTLTVDASCHFSRNSATLNGGGICNTGSLTVGYGTSFYDNQCSGEGGGIYNTNDAVIDGTSFSYNTASNGGGIYNNDSVQMVAGYFEINTAAEAGGGIYNDGAGVLTMTSTTFNSNIASGGAGGGIYTDGILGATNSTFGYNDSLGSGGGIYFTNSGSQSTQSDKLTNVTIADNVCDSLGNSNGSDYVGGGVYADPSSTILLTLNNSIVADNHNDSIYSPADDLAGLVNSNSGYNLIGAATNVGISNGSNGNQVGSSANPINPMLAPLDDYGEGGDR